MSGAYTKVPTSDIDGEGFDVNDPGLPKKNGYVALILTAPTTDSTSKKDLKLDGQEENLTLQQLYVQAATTRALKKFSDYHDQFSQIPGHFQILEALKDPNFNIFEHIQSLHGALDAKKEATCERIASKLPQDSRDGYNMYEFSVASIQKCLTDLSKYFQQPNPLIKARDKEALEAFQKKFKEEAPIFQVQLQTYTPYIHTVRAVIKAFKECPAPPREEPTESASAMAATPSQPSPAAASAAASATASPARR